MKTGQKEVTERKELPNQERIKTFIKKKNDKYVQILEADIIKQTKMKKKPNKTVPQTNAKTSGNQTLQQTKGQRIQWLYLHSFDDIRRLYV